MILIRNSCVSIEPTASITCAVNVAVYPQLLGTPLPTDQLLSYALVGEQYASGGLNADNVAPSLMGGMIFCPAVLLPEIVRLPVPTGVKAVLMHPELQVDSYQLLLFC